VEIDLVGGSGGVFALTVNGVEIFSKKRAGHFPEPDEIIALIRQTSQQ